MHAVMDQLRESLGSDFEFTRPLGEGTVAEVFLAREKALDRPVAVKVLRSRLALDDEPRQRFLREARLSARIHHPSVVAVHRVGELEPDGRPYLVMEYIDGRTFEDILAAAGPLSEADTRRVLAAVADALEAAHALGVIHRDIRPANVMRTRDGDRIVLTDFGLAGVHDTGGAAVTRLTAAGQILGDVRYAPPEQLVGESAAPGSDLYALAVTGYELLTGGGPFPDATTDAQRIRSHIEGEPVPLRTLRPEVSPGLEDALLRCLNKQPGRRPSARQLAEVLAAEDAAARSPAVGAAASPAGPGVAADAGSMERFLAELKRRRVYKVGAGYGAFLLVVLAIVDGALPALPYVADWVDTALVTAVLAGLPVALVLGWFYDVRGGSVERTPALTPGTPGGVRALQVAALLVVLAVAGLIAWIFLR